MYEVVSLKQDLAEKWYARVVISPDETIFLKFQEMPTQEEIDALTNDFLARRQEISDAITE